MTKPVKVLLVDTSQKGALPLYTAMIAQALAAAGAEPVVLANSTLIDPEVEGYWKVLRQLKAGAWPPPPGDAPASAVQQLRRWLSLALSIIRVTVAERPDIVHFQHPIHPRLDGLLVRMVGRLAPVVWTAHDVLPHDPSSNAKVRARATYRASALTLVHSIPAAEQVREISGVEALVIRHPVRQLSLRITCEEARARLRLDPKVRVACAVGFIRSYKGYGLLVDALALVKRSDLRLLVLGQLVDASEQGVLDSLASDPRADLRVGYASEADLVAAIAASDVMLLPHAAGSDSGSLHMARALGVPVLASDAPQLSSVVAQTKAGFILPRRPEVWARALQDRLPEPPPPPPTVVEIGKEHLAAYAEVLRPSAALGPM